MLEVDLMAVSRIDAQNREVSTEKSKKLRREGYVPAVIYGHRDATKNIKVNHNEIRNLIIADEKLLSSSCPLIGVYEGSRPSNNNVGS